MPNHAEKSQVVMQATRTSADMQTIRENGQSISSITPEQLRWVNEQSRILLNPSSSVLEFIDALEIIMTIHGKEKAFPPALLTAVRSRLYSTDDLQSFASGHLLLSGIERKTIEQALLGAIRSGSEKERNNISTALAEAIVRSSDIRISRFLGRVLRRAGTLSIEASNTLVGLIKNKKIPAGKQGQAFSVLEKIDQDNAKKILPEIELIISHPSSREEFKQEYEFIELEKMVLRESVRTL